MKNINIKIPRIIILALLFGAFLIPVKTTNADLNKYFRKNFTKITQEQCFNSISYSVDDLTGFEKNDKNKWECQGGKCEEYQTLVNCIFDNAFSESVNTVNAGIKKTVGKKINELNDSKTNTAKGCLPQSLQLTIDGQNKFITKCDTKSELGIFTACRVTETVLNELCGYQNFLTAKSLDFESFRNEKSNYRVGKTTQDAVFDEKSAKYVFEIEKSKKAFIETATLYKNFIHNYRIHAWLVAVKTELNSVKEIWVKIHKALETFPGKFIDASSQN